MYTGFITIVVSKAKYFQIYITARLQNTASYGSMHGIYNLKALIEQTKGATKGLRKYAYTNCHNYYSYIYVYIYIHMHT